MSDTKITVEIDGVPHNISDCSWFFIAPCGCTSGVMSAKDYDNGGWITSAGAAHASMTPNRAVREQDIARGETIELGLRADTVTRMKGDCPHTPMWGREAIPAGTAWGYAGGRVAHLVDEEPTNVGGFHARTPRCGAKRDTFDIHPSALHDAPMCKKCLAYAKEQQP